MIATKNFQNGFSISKSSSSNSLTMKTLQLNVNKLNNAYQTIKSKLENFDAQFQKRISLITSEINKQIIKLLDEIEKLNNLLKLDFQKTQNRIKIEKSEFDKNLTEIDKFLKGLNKQVDVKEDLQKLKHYQSMIEQIPKRLNQSLHSLVFSPVNVKNFNYMNTIGLLSNVKPIENFVFNFSVNYKSLKNPLVSLTEFKQNLLLLELNSSHLHVLNRNTFNYEEKIHVFDHNSNEITIRCLCVLANKSKVCVVDKTSSSLLLLDDNFNLVKQVNFVNDYNEYNRRRFEAIEYNEENKRVYLLDSGHELFYVFDDELNFSKKIQTNLPFCNTYSYTFKIFSNRIYLSDIPNKCYYVLDENGKYLSKFPVYSTNQTFKYSQLILSDTKRLSNYLLIFDLYDKSVKIYDSINFEYIKTIFLTGITTINNAIIIDDTIVFLTDQDLQVFDIL